MKVTTGRIVAIAVVAGLLGVAASLLSSGPGPLLRSEIGQRVLQTVIASNAPEPPPGLTVAQRGKIVPALQLPSLDGRPVALPAAYAGRPMLINIWATWCGPCIAEMPELDRYAATQGANGVQVVGIALDDAAAARAFLQRVPVRYPILLDVAGPADSSVRLGNPKGVLPYSVLVDADGRLVKQRIGPFEHGEIEGWAGTPTGTPTGGVTR
ncbi:TlpA family protein disulfide reductase [Montanilutibacter psychrotolerans]|uniref:TlpA family protein disulfide reductase n=1 Tax=Montanilutibacter psychrotolerans TaxID=1327343 RepID=A0A3M8SNK4_9GAMM|nr:TlpA disulfide reductase family protein [Lysobacter psychrotolerans]RNF82265.1 TlpA family protein disulfide reductase [Lysobacter psychrotolerans]